MSYSKGLERNPPPQLKKQKNVTLAAFHQLKSAIRNSTSHLFYVVVVFFREIILKVFLSQPGDE